MGKAGGVLQERHRRFNLINLFPLNVPIGLNLIILSQRLQYHSQLLLSWLPLQVSIMRTTLTLLLNLLSKS